MGKRSVCFQKWKKQENQEQSLQERQINRNYEYRKSRNGPSVYYNYEKLMKQALDLLMICCRNLCKGQILLPCWCSIKLPKKSAFRAIFSRAMVLSSCVKFTKNHERLQYLQPFRQVMLVVMHPHLENIPPNSNIVAKHLNGLFILL